MMMTMLRWRLILLILVAAASTIPSRHQASSFVLPLIIISKAEQRSSSSSSASGSTITCRRKIQDRQPHQQQRQHQQHAIIAMSPSSSSRTTTVTTDNYNAWVSLDPESLVSAKCLIEQTLCQATTSTILSSSGGGANGKQDDIVEIMPRLAKNVNHATAILDAWRLDEQDDFDNTGGHAWKTIWQPRSVIYQDKKSGTKLYGHLIGRVPDKTSSASSGEKEDKKQQKNKKMMIPGIVLFHTGAGPHDLFLLWKAAAIVNQLYSNNDNSENNNGCLVLIADILSDESGWAWDDDEDNSRTRYNQARDHVLKLQNYDDHAGGGGQQRPVLRQRIQAAIDTLLQSKLTVPSPSPSSSSISDSDDDAQTDDDDDNDTHVWTVDPNRVAALGWCLGGHAILELACMTRQLQLHDDTDAAATTPCSIRALATFHGVFDGLSSSDDETSQQEQEQQQDEPSSSFPTFRTEVLICHGTKDPFVSDDCLERALACLQQQPHITTSLLQLQGARHGFTNPAQDFHPNQQAFGYNHEGATKAWKQAMNVLRRNLVS